MNTTTTHKPQGSATAPAVDWTAFRQFLQLIGRDTGPLVLAVFPAAQTGPCIHIPADAADLPIQEVESTLKRNPGHSFGVILNTPLPEPADWGTLPEHKNKAGRIKAWGASNPHIASCIGPWAEADGGLTIEAQEALPGLAGLPEPTLQNWTGGKSLHQFWLLEPGETLTPEQFRSLQKRLAARLAEVAPAAEIDDSLSNPCRVMRAPGGLHPKTGDRCHIHKVNDRRFTVAELEALLPAPAAAEPQKRIELQEAPRLQIRQPRPLEWFRDALAYIPEVIADTGDRKRCLELYHSLRLALAEHGHDEAMAVQLLAEHSPTVHDLEDGRYEWQPTEITAGSFWGVALKHGYVWPWERPGYRAAPAADPLCCAEDVDGPHPPVASFRELIENLPDGWRDPSENEWDEAEDEGRRTGRKPQAERKHRRLTPGALAEMLPRDLLRFNELILLAEVHTHNGWVQIRETDMDSAYVLLSAKGWNVGIEPIIKAITHVARENLHRPVQDYLKRIEADPAIEPFDLDEVAPRFFRASEPLHKAMVRKWLIGAAARAMDPGSQMDYALVLQSDREGLGKSTGFEALASPDWFNCSVPDQDKDFLLNVHSCWIFELAELEHVTARREAGRMRNLITTKQDLVRLPYGRANERLKRSSVFCGTVNAREFLRDPTSDQRRYWVVPIEGGDKLDRDGLKAARDGIWKAAVMAWRSGELPMLSDDLDKQSREQNREFSNEDAWLPMLRAWVDGNPLVVHMLDPDSRKTHIRPADPSQPFTIAAAIYSAGLKPLNQIHRGDENRVAPLLRELGFEKVRLMVNRRRAWLWRPIAQPAQPAQPQESGGWAVKSTAAQEVSEIAQPAQPISKKGKTFSGDGGGRQGAAPENEPSLSEKGWAGWATPSDPLPRNGSEGAQPPLGRVGQVGQAGQRSPGSAPDCAPVIQNGRIACWVDGEGGWTRPAELRGASVFVTHADGRQLLAGREQISDQPPAPQEPAIGEYEREFDDLPEAA